MEVRERVKKAVPIIKRAIPALIPMCLAGAQVALAFDPPTAGFAYDAYDIAVNKILKGPLGFVAGVGAMAYGAASLLLGRFMPAVTGIIGGALLLKAEAVTASLGLTF
ncbi:MAG: hypothetical protein ACK4F9_07385 [Brevinematia bacterium]